jgi:Protein of unknown function (DUF402)
MRMFRYGEIAIVRQVRARRCWLEVPVRVIRDDGAVLITYVPSGAPFTFPDADFPWGEHPWRDRGAWVGPGMLVQQRAGEPHAVCALWTGAGRRFSGWYINFQDPFRRTADGFDSLDHVVDLVLGVDGRYQWKDVEEFEQFVAEGRFTTAEARAIRVEAARVAADLGQGRRWWDDGYASWSPPPHWDNP